MASGTIPKMIPQRNSVKYLAWETVVPWRSDGSALHLYLPCSSLKEGSYTANAVNWTCVATNSSSGNVTGDVTPSSIVRASPDLICIHYSKPSAIAANAYGLAGLRSDLTITAT